MVPSHLTSNACPSYSFGSGQDHQSVLLRARSALQYQDVAWDVKETNSWDISVSLVYYYIKSLRKMRGRVIPGDYLDLSIPRAHVQ